MGFLANMKGNKALTLQSKGKHDEARALYAEAVKDGLDNPRALLAYALLLIRAEDYEQAKAILVKAQKAPGITAEQKSQLVMDYAVCCHKQGDIERGVDLLERQHRRKPTGSTYETLGYLYVEQYDMGRKDAFLAATRAAQAKAAEDDMMQPATQTPEELWDAGAQKTMDFNMEALDYDDEDSITMDNIAQTYYRVIGDRAAAKEWFEKAIALRPNQLDTLWFLSRYDVEAGDTAAAIEKLETAQAGEFSPLNYATRQMVEDELKRLKG